MKIISLIGYSGSGKTQFVSKAIKLLKEKINYDVAVIKNIHEHQIDKEGKDSFKYSQAGANYSITKNILNETVIFIKKELDIEKILDWISKGPYNVDLIFLEGFRNLNYSTILCLKNWEELESQLTDKVKLISGLVCSKDIFMSKRIKLDIPIIDIENEFNKFLKIFNIN